MNPYNPSELLQYLKDTASTQEKEFIDSPKGQESFKKFKEMWNELHTTKLSFKDLEPNNYYWLHNIGPLYNDHVWRIVYCEFDNTYKTNSIKLIGQEKPIYESYLTTWIDTYFIKLNYPHDTI